MQFGLAKLIGKPPHPSLHMRGYLGKDSNSDNTEILGIISSWPETRTCLTTRWNKSIDNIYPPPQNGKVQGLIMKLSAPNVTMSTYKYRGHGEPEQIVTGTRLNSLHPGPPYKSTSYITSAQQEEHTCTHLWFKAHECLLCRRGMDTYLADLTLGTILNWEMRLERLQEAFIFIAGTLWNHSPQAFWWFDASAHCLLL